MWWEAPILEVGQGEWEDETAGPYGLPPMSSASFCLWKALVKE